MALKCDLGENLGYEHRTKHIGPDSPYWQRATISTIRCTAGEVIVFDSLHPAPMIDLINQITAILYIPKKKLKINYIGVLLQEGFSDCVEFAIAYATLLAYGKQLGRCFLNKE